MKRKRKIRGTGVVQPKPKRVRRTKELRPGPKNIERVDVEPNHLASTLEKLRAELERASAGWDSAAGPPPPEVLRIEAEISQREQQLRLHLSPDQLNTLVEAFQLLGGGAEVDSPEVPPEVVEAYQSLTQPSSEAPLRCDFCLEREPSAHLRPNPYIQDIQNREELQVICDDCHSQLCDEI